ncbi:MAG: hypothetical protein AB2L24_24830 [Mangrovibacterium sp.]
MHSFVLAAHTELPRHQRINIVSPGLIAGSEEDKGNRFPQLTPVSIDKLINAYTACIEG